MEVKMVNADKDYYYCFEKGSPEETLFIPLFVKAEEFVSKAPIVKDQKAFEIARSIGTHPKRFDGGSIAGVGILTRTQLFDKAVTEFIKSNPEGVVINLGVGLDTRSSRFDNGRLRWYEVDLPDVIRLRRMFFTENERIRFIPESVADLRWAEKTGATRTDRVLILAEGLLMYLSEEQVKGVFEYICDCFPGADLYFDVIHSYFVGKAITSPFVWGIDRAEEITGLHPGIRLVENWSIGDFNKKRQSLFLRIMNILPSTRNRSRIIHAVADISGMAADRPANRNIGNSERI